MLDNTKDYISGVFDKYKSTVYRCSYAYCKNSFDSSDIVQEVFLRYIKSAPTFQNAEHQRAWIIRVTINCCKKLLKSGWKKYTQALDETLATEQPEHSELYYAITKLPTKYRLVIHLYYYEDYNIKEISYALNKTYSSVSTMLYRARAMLKEKLEKERYYAEKSIQANI